MHVHTYIHKKVVKTQIKWKLSSCIFITFICILEIKLVKYSQFYAYVSFILEVMKLIKTTINGINL